MPNYWCVNLDSEACLQHGIKHQLWMMQYQYADDHGNIFQDGRQRAATTSNWKRMKEINIGDRFVAYLRGNKFYAVGTVITPRTGRTPLDPTDTIDEYVSRKKSHDHSTGYVYYTPVFYENFTDEWRHPDDPLMRYAQRIDVDEWLHYVPNGVSVKGLGDIPPNEKAVHAVFPITKTYYERIAKKLASEHVVVPKEDDAGGVTVAEDDAVVEALEKSHAKRQGFQLDSKTRKAIEDHAMEAATKHFMSQGYSVEDHHKRHPYDLLCLKKKQRLYVEVKGTVTGGDGIILTNGEVKFARSHKGEIGLFILHSIQVSADGKVSNGKRKVIVPWDVDKGKLKPMAFNYEVP
jgi:glutathione S-transferase